jgi:hypothetical protein
MLSTIKTEIRKLSMSSAPLAAAAALMLVAFVGSVAGIFLDGRSITGVPAWLKPAKFAISTALFLGTMAWLFRYITVWPRFTRTMGWVLAIVLVLEVFIIDLQAARGTTSHFNVSTALDGMLFSIMGAAIAILWLASIGVLAALFRQKFTDSAWGWWLRMGMMITVVGSSLGGLMVSPSPDQLEAMRANHAPAAVGAHTVGGPDGGPGIAGVGWSTQHGDLRIPHFFGLHGIQIVPFLGWLALRRRNRQAVASEIRLALGAAVSYLAFVTILTWQALRGQSVTAPDAATLVVFVLWLLGSALALLSLRGRASLAQATLLSRGTV